MNAVAWDVWNGDQDFHVSGTERFEDTLRIDVSSARMQSERPLQLILPTLCITYAEMGFTNAIGGEQENFPVSAAYGPRFFNPPVEIVGEPKVEMLTWIRGAHRVVIDPKVTLIEWHPWRTLVIPRLRIDRDKAAIASLRARDVRISPSEEFTVDVRQMADGRSIGGLCIARRHPDWKPPQDPKDYDLWLRVIDAQSQEPISEAQVNLLSWIGKGATGPKHGGFRVTARLSTDGGGAVHEPHRPLTTKEAVTVTLPGWRVTPRCYKPLPGQPIRFHMRATRLSRDNIRYVWREGDTLARLAALGAVSEQDILDANRLSAESVLHRGVHMDLPCFAASVHLGPNETVQEVARRFAYDPAELAAANGVNDPACLDGGSAIKLPGWHVFYASGHETLESFDERFGRPKGSARTMGRVHHPDRQLPYFWEPVAVPTEAFAANHKL